MNPPDSKPYLWQDFGYTYTYDSRSYLTALTDSLGRSWWDTPSYDYMDRVTSVRKGASLTTTRTYRPEDGVLTGITTGSVQAMTFGFDGLGNFTSRADTGVSETYGYDNLNRLEKRNGGVIAAYQANGNIASKTEVGGSNVTINFYDAAAVANPADTTAVRNLPHAVSQYTISVLGNAQIISLKYDLNGNLLTRTNATTGETWNMKWCGFDKPRWMAKTAAALTATPVTATGSEFHYNAARSRTMQLEFDQMNNAGPTHYNRKRIYALGSTLELNYNNTTTSGSGQTWDLKKVRIYVPGPDGIIGAREFDVTSGVTGTEKALVYHYDHLGSITATTLHTTGAVANDSDASNPKPAKYSEDAWGQRRNPFTWSGAPLTTGTNKSDDGSFDSSTPRGYTGHEMLDDLGLVHMNGRIYDPLLGRFLSADLLVQNPASLQSYNRYTYVGNNPLSLTDPSGFAAAGGTNNAADQSALAQQAREKAQEQLRDAAFGDGIFAGLGQITDGAVGASTYVTIAANTTQGDNKGGATTKVGGVTPAKGDGSIKSDSTASPPAQGKTSETGTPAPATPDPAPADPKSATNPFMDAFNQGMAASMEATGIVTGAAGALAGTVENTQNGATGIWIGKNLKAYSTSWGGNGSTGGRLAFAGKMAGVAKTAGNTFGVVGLGVSAVQGYNAFKNNDGNGMFQAGADITMGGVGFLGPIGWAASTGYFIGQSLDRWSGFSDDLAYVWTWEPPHKK